MVENNVNHGDEVGTIYTQFQTVTDSKKQKSWLFIYSSSPGGTSSPLHYYADVLGIKILYNANKISSKQDASHKLYLKK